MGAGSSFSLKDALTPLSPSTSPSLPLRRQWLPLPTSSCPAKGRPPLRLAPPPLLAAGLAAGMGDCRPCRLAATGRAHGRCFCSQAPPLWAAAPCGHRWPLFRATLAASNRPLAGDLCHDLAVGGRPYMGAGRPSSSRPSLRKHNKNA
ncbi:hypothetical protein GW17_00061049 [Ensete ventricosum]|nr:hypothetical protein GW17_00061049 [Ensete ventricosum]